MRDARTLWFARDAVPRTLDRVWQRCKHRAYGDGFA
jgi:hypothetical protein